MVLPYGLLAIGYWLLAIGFFFSLLEAIWYPIFDKLIEKYICSSYYYTNVMRLTIDTLFVNNKTRKNTYFSLM